MCRQGDKLLLIRRRRRRRRRIYFPQHQHSQIPARGGAEYDNIIYFACIHICDPTEQEK